MAITIVIDWYMLSDGMTAVAVAVRCTLKFQVCGHCRSGQQCECCGEALHILVDLIFVILLQFALLSTL